MTEPTAPDAPPAPDTSLEETLDAVLGKYVDTYLHRWTYMAHADRGDLASDLAEAARASAATATRTPVFVSPEDRADPLLGALARLSDIDDQASCLEHTVASVDAPRVRQIRLAVSTAYALVSAVRSMSAQVLGPVDDPAADPPLWATANAAMVELFRAVRCLQVEDVARLDQSKVLDARRSMEWVENMPTVLWPPLSIDDEEPF